MVKFLIAFMLIVSMAHAQPSNRQIRYNAALQAMDYFTTTHALSHGFVEGNTAKGIWPSPSMKYIVSNPTAFAATKIILFYGTKYMSKKELRWFNVFYTIVIANNVYQISRIE